MHRIFETPTEIRRYHVSKVGYSNKANRIYIAPDRPDRIEVWSCNLFIACSWQCVVRMPFEEVLFSVYALSGDGATVGVLAICIKKNETSIENNHPKVQFYMFDAESGCPTCYTLHEDSGIAFDTDVFLDNLILGHSIESGWYMYDRSVVTGPIPFWYLVFTKDLLPVVPDEIGKFKIIDRKIVTVEEVPCQRYAVLLEGKSRKFVKFSDEKEIYVFDDRMDSWIPYIIVENGHLLANKSFVRGVAETIGRRGHRMAAVESALSIFSDNGNYLAKVYENGVHSFYTLLFDHLGRTVSLKWAAEIELNHSFDRTFYPLCTEREVVLIGCSPGQQFLTIIAYQPPSLRHSVAWAIQRLFAKKNQIGAWIGGIRETDLRRLAGYCGTKPLI